MRFVSCFGLSLFLLAGAMRSATGAPAEVPKPAATKADEPIRKTWSPVKAGEYLDGVGVNWTRDRKCITCHTNMPYMLGRPTLPGDGWKEVRSFLETEVAGWEKGGKVRGPAYVVATAFALAFNDAQTAKQLHPQTRSALDLMWDQQLPTGEWKWLKCAWPPMEHDDYYGATVAALAAGLAPGHYPDTDKARAGFARLKAYLAKTPAPDLHHSAMLLWASAKIDGLLTEDAKRQIIAKLKGQQHEDGGWSLPSLGDYKRRDGTANDPAAASDGYATGLVAYVLMQAGSPSTDPAVAKGIVWLKSNQRASGRWFTRSLNNDKAHYITNAGTAFAVLAIDAAKR